MRQVVCLIIVDAENHWDKNVNLAHNLFLETWFRLDPHQIRLM